MDILLYIAMEKVCVTLLKPVYTAGSNCHAGELEEVDVLYCSVYYIDTFL